MAVSRCIITMFPVCPRGLPPNQGQTRPPTLKPTLKKLLVRAVRSTSIRPTNRGVYYRAVTPLYFCPSCQMALFRIRGGTQRPNVDDAIDASNQPGTRPHLGKASQSRTRVIDRLGDDVFSSKTSRPSASLLAAESARCPSPLSSSSLGGHPTPDTRHPRQIDRGMFGTVLMDGTHTPMNRGRLSSQD